MNIKPLIPYWKSGKNKFLRFEKMPFNDGFNHTAMITYAIYLNKNNTVEEIPAFIKWSN